METSVDRPDPYSRPAPTPKNDTSFGSSYNSSKAYNVPQKSNYSPNPSSYSPNPSSYSPNPSAYSPKPIPRITSSYQGGGGQYSPPSNFNRQAPQDGQYSPPSNFNRQVSQQYSPPSNFNRQVPQQYSPPSNFNRQEEQYNPPSNFNRQGSQNNFNQPSYDSSYVQPALGVEQNQLAKFGTQKESTPIFTNDPNIKGTKNIGTPMLLSKPNPIVPKGYKSPDFASPPNQNSQEKYCYNCNSYMPPRATHCSNCGKKL